MADFGFTLDEMDIEAFFNMRNWLQKSVEANGAKMTGGGVGCGQADIDVEIEGHRYNISIRPLKNHDATPKPSDSINNPGT